MIAYTLTLEKMLGKEKYEQLVSFTLKNIQNKFNNINYNKALEMLEINHQLLIIIAIQKAKKISDENISSISYLQDNECYKNFLKKDIREFIKLYSNYINDIVNFIDRE